MRIAHVSWFEHHHASWTPHALAGQPPRAGESGAGDTLKQFHAASSGLKSMCTGVTAAGIEDCRKACGGHGFLQSSGLPEHLGTYLQACTVEGDNYMLTQQVCRVGPPPVILFGVA